MSLVISGLLTLFLCSLARNQMSPTAPITARIRRIISREDMMWMEHPGQEHWIWVAWLRVEEVRLESVLEQRRSSLKLFHLRRLSS